MTKDIEIAVEVRVETAKALLVFDGKTEVLIPKSQISEQCEDHGQINSIFISEWLAGEKGLI